MPGPHLVPPDLRDQIQALIGRVAELERRAARGVEDWHLVGGSGEPAFQGTWHNVGGAASVAAFYKDPAGVVRVKGRITAGTSATTAFTLPAGYRPVADEYFLLLVSAAASGAFAAVDTDGHVIVTHGGASEVFLQLSFRAA